jgi:hypothetical protein
VGMAESTEPVLRNDNVVDGSEHLNPSRTDIHDAFAFTEDIDHDLTPPAARTVVDKQSTPTTRPQIPTSSVSLIASDGSPQFSLGAVSGRPPTDPRRPLPHAMGQYQQGRGRTGGPGRTRGRTGTHYYHGSSHREGTVGARASPAPRGQNNAEASSSRPTRRPLIGIGARDPNQVIEPFVDTYVPGRTSSTPAFVVPTPRSGITGPIINSDAEDPQAHRHKRLKRVRCNDGTELQLRNENSEVESVRASDGSDADNEVDYNDEADDADVPNCDEAPADDDVVIRDGIVRSLSTQTVRRSSRLRN